MNINKINSNLEFPYSPLSVNEKTGLIELKTEDGTIKTYHIEILKNGKPIKLSKEDIQQLTEQTTTIFNQKLFKKGNSIKNLEDYSIVEKNIISSDPKTKKIPIGKDYKTIEKICEKSQHTSKNLEITPHLDQKLEKKHKNDEVKSDSKKKETVNQDKKTSISSQQILKEKFKNLLLKSSESWTSEEIADAVKYADAVSKQKPISNDNKQQIREFFDLAAKLPVTTWDRHKLLGGKRELQCILSNDLNYLYHTKDQIEERHLKESIAQAQLSVQMGHPVSGSEGVNGTVIINSLDTDEPIGVFKAPRQAKWYDVMHWLRLLFGQERLLQNVSTKGREHWKEYSEVAAYNLSKKLGFNMAPASKMCQIQGKYGSFLVFLDGHKPAKKIMPQFNNKKTYTKHEINVFQKMAIYDYLTGNMDCHQANWFVKMKKDKKGNDTDEIDEIKTIDHGNAFINQNPSGLEPDSNQYQWASLNIAKQAFTEETKQFVKEMKEEDLESFISSYKAIYRDEKAMYLLRQRFKTIKSVVGVTASISQSPSTLGKIRTNSEFSKAATKFGIGIEIIEIYEEAGGFLMVDIKD